MANSHVLCVFNMLSPRRRLCLCSIAVLTSASILFLQSRISHSLVLPPSSNFNSATPIRMQRKKHRHFRQISSSSIHVTDQNGDNSGIETMPSHYYQEDDDAYTRPSKNFDRQNYSRRKELSERNKYKLNALSSFGSGDDEWDEYANMNYDVNNDSNEKSDAYIESMERGTDRHVVDESNKKQSGISTLNEANSKSNESIHDASIGRDEADAFSSTGASSNDNAAVSDFRKKFQSKPNIQRDRSSDTNAEPSAPPNPKTRTRITSEQIEEIKSSISIVDAIESYNLPNFVRTNSHSAKACCPFHDDNNPSMSIDDGRGLYKCFACGAGGDLFNFIREYDALDGKQDKMGFMKAVQYAVREFGDKRLEDIGDFETVPRSWDDSISEESKAKLIEKERMKNRIRQANNAAAAFYTKCLVTLPTAGKARAHLRSRKLSPDSIRTFALGYAPDFYYGDESTSESTDAAKKTWGEGSLVEYLSNMGFTPNEIVESGLAVRTKSKSANKPQSMEDESLDCSDLMDRFRNRLVVPILDKKGKDVIGFGGRHLESMGTTDSSYTPAKYINSPESAIFKKKFVLFNEHNAKTSIEEYASDVMSNEERGLNHTMFGARHLPLIIVEGYFDAISVANVGVKNVVASMGTALTVEQLKNAAAMVDSKQIIFCMDNDDAGRNAVQRICSSNMITKTSELSGTDILVATLPNGIKDPSDFVASKESDAKSRFENEVIQLARPWDQWYITQIAQKYDADSKDGTSFAAICEEVSSFLAVFPNAADRTRRVHNIVDILLDLISKDSDSKSSLGMMRVQLESDMLNIVSRKASARESIERRIEEKDGFSGEADRKLDVITRGEIAEVDENDQRLSKSALAKLNAPTRRNHAASMMKQPTPTRRTFKQKPPRRATFKTSNGKQQQRDLIPHFNGFTFDRKSDRDWLGLSGRSKRKMYLGSTGLDDDGPKLRAELPVFDTFERRSKDGPVYFNSNQYVGERYLTQTAMDAGYFLSDSDRPTSGESLEEFTDRILLERDAEHMIVMAESRLLHALAKYSQARAIMRSVYAASTFTPPNMKWTSEERLWLFECLTGTSDPPLSPELLEDGNARQLRSHLASRTDCPQNGFISDSTNSLSNNPPSNEAVIDEDSSLGGAYTTDKQSSHQQNNIPSNGRGSLETYFMDASHLFPSFRKTRIAEETRAELTVQETVATLLRATATKRFLSVKRQLAKIVFEMDRRGDSGGEEDQLSFDEDFSTTSSEELQELFDSVALEVMEAQQSLYEADRSTDRVNAHLLDYSAENSVQYKTSQAEVERLEKMMDDHIASLPDDIPDAPGDDDAYVFDADELREQLGTDPYDYMDIAHEMQKNKK